MNEIKTIRVSIKTHSELKEIKDTIATSKDWTDLKDPNFDDVIVLMLDRFRYLE